MKPIPAKNLKWGKPLLNCCPPECEVGRTVVQAVKSGKSLRQIGEMLGTSDALTEYYMRRLSQRDRDKRILDKALTVFDANLFQIATILTVKQFEASRMLLAGSSETEAAKTLGVTQSAVSSRLRYARAMLALRGAAWARTVLEGLETVGKARNLSRFQLKSGTRGKRGKKMNEQKNEVVRETAVTVEMSASELNFAVASWAAAQPEASADLKKLVADGANINVTVKPDGTGGTMRVWRETGPQFKIGE